MLYYPIYLDLRGRLCVVVGGGTVAERKVTSLLECGADVTVISPEVTLELQTSAQAGRIRVERRDYRNGDLAGAFIAIGATDDPVVNAEVAAEGRMRGVLVNTVDDLPNCDFIAPSVVRRGDLVLAISTGGRSPAMARRVREELEKSLPLEYGDLLQVLDDVRKAAREQGEIPPYEKWDQAITPEVFALLEAGSLIEAKCSIARAVGLVESCPCPRVNGTAKGANSRCWD